MDREKMLQIAKTYLDELNEKAERIREEMIKKQQEYFLVTEEIRRLSLFVHSAEGQYAYDAKGLKLYEANDIKDGIAKILAEIYPKTLHYKAIMKMLNERGFYIVGKNPMQNLLSYLSRDERFVRGEKRGEYRLGVMDGIQKTIA